MSGLFARASVIKCAGIVGARRVDGRGVLSIFLFLHYFVFWPALLFVLVWNILSNLAAVCVAYGVGLGGWEGGGGDWCQGSAVELMFLGASFLEHPGLFCGGYRVGSFLFRLNVSAMDAYAFEWVCLLRLFCFCVWLAFHPQTGLRFS